MTYKYYFEKNGKSKNAYKIVENNVNLNPIVEEAACVHLLFLNPFLSGLICLAVSISYWIRN